MMSELIAGAGAGSKNSIVGSPIVTAGDSASISVAARRRFSSVKNGRTQTLNSTTMPFGSSA